LYILHTLSAKFYANIFFKQVKIFLGLAKSTRRI
jgi:hypothetical protein